MMRVHMSLEALLYQFCIIWNWERNLWQQAISEVWIAAQGLVYLSNVHRHQRQGRSGAIYMWW